MKKPISYVENVNRNGVCHFSNLISFIYLWISFLDKQNMKRNGSGIAALQDRSSFVI